MREPNDYTTKLRQVKSLLLVGSLQKREDMEAAKSIQEYREALNWDNRDDLMIDPKAWDYVMREIAIDPKLVFCHPDILCYDPKTSLYYRGLSGLSLKAAKDYCGGVESLEIRRLAANIDIQRAIRIARAYNTFICSIINGSASWTLENGFRTIIATIGISIDGSNRNKIGEKAEQLIHKLIVEWLMEHKLIIEPHLSKPDLQNDNLPSHYRLPDDISMSFSSEPDVSFRRASELLAIVEIKGGIDPAGALERYGAARKSFQHAVDECSRCKNFYLVAAVTNELLRRISDDRLVEKTFNIIEMLDDQDMRETFCQELFHYTLRII